MSWFDGVVPPLDSRGPLSWDSFIHLVVPPLLCTFVTSALTTLPSTFLPRLALLPLTLWTSFRCATRLDLSYGFEERGLVYWNHGMVLALVTLCMRALGTLTRTEVLIRTPPSKTRPASPPAKQTWWKWTCDVCDLIINLRGLGWNWSKGLHVAHESRPTSSTARFLLSTLLSFLSHIIIFDLLHYTIQSFSPNTFGSPSGGTIFDPSLPVPLRYIQSTTICFLSGLTVYCAIQTVYDLLTVLAIIILRQHPSQWPPVFDSPWAATSVSDFWSRRWHQLFRDNFILTGFNPFSLVLGRFGGVLGAFFMSGLLHDFGLWAMGNGREVVATYGFFLLMGVGTILESAWKELTGIKLRGTAIGWVWTVFWVVGWSHILVDGWAKKGLIGSVFFPTQLRSSTYVFGTRP